MKKAISTDLSPENIEKALALLIAGPSKLARLSKAIAPNKPLGKGERSLTEGFAHLIHVEAISSQSIYIALMLNTPLLHPIHAERDLGKLLQLDILSVPELLSYYNLRRKILLGVLKQLTVKQWARTIKEAGKQRQESVYWRVRGLALHELEHLADIETKSSNLTQSIIPAFS